MKTLIVLMVMVCSGAIIAEGKGADAVVDVSFPDTTVFDYDQSQPIDVQVIGILESGLPTVKLEEITIASPVAGRITATLVRPEGADRKKAPGIVFMHWGQGNRSEFLWEATMYARSGAICLVSDAPWARPEPWRQASEGMMTKPDIVRIMYRQTVIDLRRCVDVLCSREDVDPSRIFYIGHSFGATWGGALAGVEHRFAGLILMGGLPTITDFSPSGARSFDDMSGRIRAFLTPEQIEDYCSSLESINPVNFVGRAAPSHLFFQFATYDTWISRTAAEHYYAAASEPKTLVWYPTSHEFTCPEAFHDRARWLQERGALPR